MLDFLTILIPWTPALAALACGVIGLDRRLHRLAAPVCAASIGFGFVLTVILWPQIGSGASHTTFFEWIHVGNALQIDFAYLLDPLSLVMLAVVTGIGCLIACYAAGYMEGDPGYWRFFAYVSLFIFAMTTLVMADNLVLLFLGWEGVGLCSYLLIGYYYGKPAAVAAAKKAFIVNRIGDFGFLLGIFLVYQRYGDVSLSNVLIEARANVELYLADGYIPTTADLWIPFLLMIGAFGKSAQGPLFVWLPDAMAGPTPVSALVHAATMVTAGVYLIARCLPLFELSPAALPTVAVVGGITALFAATIAMASNDLKGVFAYSTVSQLGYMFLGLGVLSASGAVFHLFTHAFFKALLFLTAGSVMHALAGQLDIRTMSGLRHKMPVTCWLMFAGCLSLAGFPLITAGFWSKDLILGDALAVALAGDAPWIMFAVICGIVTAFLTAYYSFRLWFTVFLGPERYTMGHEHHGYAPHENPLADPVVDPTAPPEERERGVIDSGAGANPYGEAEAEAHEARTSHPEDDGHHGSGGPHEMPWLPMNAPLVVLAVGAIVLGWVAHQFHWFEGITGHAVAAATPHSGGGHGADVAAYGAADLEHAGPTILGLGAHAFMMVLSSLLALLGIATAWFFHVLDRDAAARTARTFGPVTRTLRAKYYVDEFYDAAIVEPLRRLGTLFYAVDTVIINTLVRFVAFVPALVGRGIRPAQSGKMQGYGLGMAMGIAVFVLLVLMAVAS